MMTSTEIITAFGNDLLTMTDVPTLIWEDGHDDPTRPAIFVQNIVNTRTSPSLSNGSYYEDGAFLLQVMTQKGDYARDARIIADNIVAHFRKGRKIGNVGIMRIAAPPVVQGNGFPDGDDWKLPVRVNYIAV